MCKTNNKKFEPLFRCDCNIKNSACMQPIRETLLDLLLLLPGSAITPASAPTLSPNDLVIASPGMSTVFSQTLSGPSGLPLTSFYCSILPPMLTILCLSCSSDGLWSLDRGMAFQLVFDTFLAKMALESPTFEQYSFFCLIKIETTVDPDKSQSNSLANISWFVVK